MTPLFLWGLFIFPYTKFLHHWSYLYHFVVLFICYLFLLVSSSQFSINSQVSFNPNMQTGFTYSMRPTLTNPTSILLLF